MRLRGGWAAAEPVQRVLALLTDAGFRALIVGGAVRNDLLGLPVADVDLATDATPDRVIALIEAAGLRAVPTGIVHGTVTAIASGQPFEITTFRRDVETFGRNATVAFSDNMAEDAQRRDFTMNALYATPQGVVLDPVGGLPDLAARRLRFVGDAPTRIAEDYLRILRLYRFWAQYGDPDPSTHAEALAAVRPQVAGLTQISRERIGAEMRKLLAARDPAPMLAEMADSGVLPLVLPGADPTRIAALVTAEAAAEIAPSFLRRLAALGGDDPVGALRLSRAEDRHLAAIRAATGLACGAAAYRHGAEAATDATLVGGQALPHDWRASIDRAAAAQFPVKAADLSPLAGAALGARLKTLEARWIDSGFTASRDDLLAG